MEILLPKKQGKSWRKLANQLALVKPLRPFENVSLNFVQEVCKAVTKKNKPLSLELKQLTDWTSAKHLRQIHRSYESKRKGRIWLPRGLVLHFTPANVDSLFIYSWFVSLLLGNSNIIRLSRSRNAQINLILKALNSILKQQRFRLIRERNLIISYGHQETITKELSGVCQI